MIETIRGDWKRVAGAGGTRRRSLGRATAAWACLHMAPCLMAPGKMPRQQQRSGTPPQMAATAELASRRRCCSRATG